MAGSCECDYELSDRGGTMVKVSRKVSGSIPAGVIGIFH